MTVRLRRLRARLTYANVTATMALFVALGGTSAYAANTVFSSDIADGEVKAVDIGNNEVGSADVKDGSLNTFDVHSFLGVDVVDGSLTGSDLAPNTVASNHITNNTIESHDIVTGGVTADDVSNGSLTADDIADGSLKDEDIAESTHHFEGHIGTVEAHECVGRVATGIDARGDHVILTPDWTTAMPVLIYTAEYRSDVDHVVIKVCNQSDIDQVDGFTTFNLLVINGN